MRKAFDWKHSRIYMLEVEAVPQSCIPTVQIGVSIVLYKRNLLLVESFCFVEICLCQVSLLSRYNLAHDNGHTLVCDEYGYPKRSPNTNS
jgi:hypothetical protein